MSLGENDFWANSSNSIISFSLIYPSHLVLWPEDKCSWTFLLLTCIVLISFPLRPCLRGDTQAFVLNLRSAHIPVSVCWLQPFSNHSMAAVDFVYCLAGAVSPVGTSSSSSISKRTGEPPLPSHTRTPSSAVAATHGIGMAGVSSSILALTDQEKSALLLPLPWSLPMTSPYPQ